MSDVISHKGVVRKVGERETLVEILSTSACAGCHAAGLCTSFESARKEVRVPTDPSLGCRVGEEVEVLLAPKMGMKAVLLSYVIPLGILMILIVSLSFTDLHELIGGAVGLGGMAVYYLFLYLFRGRIRKEYVFSISKQHKSLI